MTEFEKKSFSVKTGSRSPENCEHGWLDSRERCVMCGVTLISDEKIGAIAERVARETQRKIRERLCDVTDGEGWWRSFPME